MSRLALGFPYFENEVCHVMLADILFVCLAFETRMTGMTTHLEYSCHNFAMLNSVLGSPF